MTISELIQELEKFPESAEVLLYHEDFKESAVIKDSRRFEIEHDDDGTPLVYITIQRQDHATPPIPAGLFLYSQRGYYIRAFIMLF